mgnify:CR=1 FL=1
MMRFALGTVLLAFGVTASAAERLPREHLEFFESKIRPLLVQHCYQCHAEDAKSIKGGLLLDSKQGWQRGGDNGAAIEPGDVDNSPLIQAVRYEEMEMPPKGKLSPSEIADLERWVKLGAPDPRDNDTTKLINREIDIEKGRQFWAFQPPRRQPAPKVKDADWPASDLDRFVLAKLEAEGISPIADAGPAVLIRRLYFDLIGLPPSPEQMNLWLAETDEGQWKPGGLEKLVDHLLASPHFGERWGRHWMDIARYAESTGMERNVTYPAAWRYRDYVIAAFNNDKPYDQFIQEQIAGDLLPGTDKDNRDERLIATGFLAMGPKSLNERDRNVFTMDIVDEQIDVTTRSVMGVTVSCARCHDHKFDPFPQRDYYALAGIFRSSNTLYGATGGNGNRQPSSLIPLGERGDASAPDNPQLAAVTKQLQQARADLKAAKEADDSAAQVKQLTRKVAQLAKRQKALANKSGGNARLPAGPAAMGVVEGNVADCRLHIRGNVKTLGESVPRGFLQVVSVEGAAAINKQQSGRLDLAHYLTSPDNPLTARVMANRTWHWLFGHGIVRTVDNFGVMGERPSNVELLDHLATRLVDSDWSTKQVIREIVLSRTYRLASDHSPSQAAKDPENLLFWRQNHRRLDAEAIRDAMLIASGKLQRKPPEASPVAKLAGKNVGRETNVLAQIDRGDFNHRSVYIPILRNAVPEVLSVFDFAEPSIIVGRRQVTTVPSQALFMMNSEFVVDQSNEFAKRLLEAEEMSDPERVRKAYRIALGRDATDAELTTTMKLLRQWSSEKEQGQEGKQEALVAVCQALLACAEFRYIE